ncbi:hypothetical protein E3Q22_01297 [Wallemia mellicola]|uniref:T-cell immunomodulatory protein TIP C2 domain-containing protein n=1 Tax=Wallemia mellicola TaxID=1708541 RepID=A0A4T0MDS0_9BASI|nr:hypothetical protein E3Q22_01297 [Wallemia mellicola]
MRIIDNRILLATTSLTTLAYGWDISTKQRFTQDGLIDAGELGLDGISGRVSALGDLNALSLDILSVDADQKTIRSHLWNHDKYTFESNSTVSVPFKISTLVATDIDHDGKLDVMAVGEGRTTTEIQLYLFHGDGNGGFDSPVQLPNISYTQPTFFDAQGRLSNDFLAYRYDAGTKDDQLSLYSNTLDDRDQPYDIMEPNFDTSTGTPCKMSQTHSNAFIDLNGDCLADLFLVCSGHEPSYQIWLNNPANDNFVLHSQNSLPKGTGMISFADFDRDGTIDMIFPTCESTTRDGLGKSCSINVVFNKQIPLCVDSRSFEALLHPSLISGGGGECRSPSELCVADDKFEYNQEKRLKIPIEQLTQNSNLRLKMVDHSLQPGLPLSLKIGDYNLDGFPDILCLLSDGSTTRGAILDNVLVNKTRSLTLRDESKTTILKDIKDVRAASWIDIDEDGSLDIMLQRLNSVTFIKNNIANDAFFIKTLMLNGACENWCDSPTAGRYKPFGVNAIGGTYKFTILDTNGKRMAASIPQLPSTAFDALLTPYSVIGLGRTNNYIENLHVGSTSKNGSSQHMNFEGIIPNSQVIITPAYYNHDWHIEMYLKTNKWIPFVTVVVAVLCVLFGAVVFGLHIHEKKEDEAERRKESHHINFQAL